jgi:FAD/FMN-containing dehydrogenase
MAEPRLSVDQSRPHPAKSRDAFLARLAEISGTQHVLTEPQVTASYETDWTRRWHGRCLAVVRPADRDEVAAVVRECGRYRASLVPQGGNTGLVGGSTPDGCGSQIVLSLARLDSVGEIDPDTHQVTVGAGVSLAALQGLARKVGFDAGLDLGARDTATIGGLAACDAGGLRAIRYGTARQRIAGLEAVLADGSVVSRMSGLLKDNAGYDVPALLVGSEGTLGVITAVRWSLVPRLDARATSLIALDSVGGAARLAGLLRGSLASLELLELMTEAGVRRTLEYLSAEPPLPVTAAWILAQCAARTDPAGELIEALDRAGVADDAIVAVDSAGTERLLRIREAHPEAANHDGVSIKLDVGVPLAALPAFLEVLPKTVEAIWPGARLIVFGHLGDGNVHVNILGPDPESRDVDEAVLGLVAEHGGTISAEHGVGRHKASYLALTRSAGERAAMRSIKRALDPDQILNPGVVLA